MGPEAVSDRYRAARERLIDTMRQLGIHDLTVLEAFSRVPREHFVPDTVAQFAYEDRPLPIGYGQTASQPSLQALYMQVLEVGQDDRVLEVGTGSGYQTAVLALLAQQVFSIERIPELSRRARRALDALRFSNVALLVGDGTVGWSRYAPYDKILVAAGSPDVPDALVQQLNEDGGRMLIPVGDRNEQRLELVTRTAQGVHTETVTQCSFVPLIGRFAWSGGEAENGDA